MKITHTAVVGLQYGDEGKGKVCQELAMSGDYDVTARFNGGPNAGHTMYHKNKKVVTHHVPAGILAGVKINLIGPGCTVDPVVLKAEVEMLRACGCDTSTIYLSELAHLITPFEKMVDAGMNGAIGTTGRGIGPTYAHSAHRVGLRVKDFFELEYEAMLEDLHVYHLVLSRIYRKDWLDISDKVLEEWCIAAEWLWANINIAPKNFFFTEGDAGQILGHKTLRILAEGAQAVMLDPIFGSYPFVTSSHCISSYAPVGLGLPGNAKMMDVIGVFKAYTTRVGEGPFPTELKDASGSKIRVAGKEVGSTTGRDRRVGWLDLPDLVDACELNGVTRLYMTKADILSPDVVGSVLLCTHKSKGIPVYKEFPPWSCKGMRTDTDLTGPLWNYVNAIEVVLGRHVDIVSVGPGAKDLVPTRPSVVV